ncbi:MAG: hypothetical protein V3U75_11665 [Methylococcaceae bacterium]
MDYKQIIPLVGALLELGFKVAELIDRAETVDPADKEALKKQIKNAQAGVKYWTDEAVIVETEKTVDGPVSEGGPVPSND